MTTKLKNVIIRTNHTADCTESKCHGSDPSWVFSAPLIEFKKSVGPNQNRKRAIRAVKRQSSFEPRRGRKTESGFTGSHIKRKRVWLCERPRTDCETGIGCDGDGALAFRCRFVPHRTRPVLA